MAKNSSRIKIGLKCADCGFINYKNFKNSKTRNEKVDL
ncbi:MAG: 50S ribosomal protein L33 [Campylobacter sp.]|nr:50S ribosomal protein L33 [Campylobacter sp.]